MGWEEVENKRETETERGGERFLTFFAVLFHTFPHSYNFRFKSTQLFSPSSLMLLHFVRQREPLRYS